VTFAVDPLLEEFDKIREHKDSKNVFYLWGDGENLSFCNGFLDFVFCVNVIDHTPNPQRMVNEIYRVLKENGKLFFEVNFDDELSPAHYGLWTIDTVRTCFTNDKWKTIKEETKRNPNYNQSLYQAIYQKI
jgi:ubiquinone/menaquinone biosynthesis C-methylase UbiE